MRTTGSEYSGCSRKDFKTKHLWFTSGEDLPLSHDCFLLISIYKSGPIPSTQIAHFLKKLEWAKLLIWLWKEKYFDQSNSLANSVSVGWPFVTNERGNTVIHNINIALTTTKGKLLDTRQGLREQKSNNDGNINNWTWRSTNVHVEWAGNILRVHIKPAITGMI